MLTTKKILFLRHIFEEPHEKSKAGLVPALAKTMEFQGCFLMVLEVFSPYTLHSAAMLESC